jgi:hypothetical protein
MTLPAFAEMMDEIRIVAQAVGRGSPVTV